jgi:hypothetical protein
MLIQRGVFVVPPDNDLRIASRTILQSSLGTSRVLREEDAGGRQSGMLPCFRFGVSTRFVFSVSNARISFGRVSCGMITSSM